MNLASYLSSFSLALLGVSATVDRWLMAQDGIASPGSVYSFALMYGTLTAVMIMREHSQVEAMKAAKTSLDMYEQLVTTLMKRPQTERDGE